MEFVYVIKRFDLFDLAFPHGFRRPWEVPLDDWIERITPCEPLGSGQEAPSRTGSNLQKESLLPGGLYGFSIVISG